MKKLLLAALLLAALPRMGAAQVEKQVEVTKAYVPRVGSAAKLPVEPDMTDTTRIRPEIDYTITPLSLQTTLTTRPIRPATVTYWEFNRPQPFYLKLVRVIRSIRCWISTLRARTPVRVMSWGT